MVELSLRKMPPHGATNGDAEETDAAPGAPQVSRLSAKGRIDIAEISVIFGEESNQFLAVDRVSLSIPAGQFLCIVGPSGCGKSTLMNAICGFEVPTYGEVRVDGEPVTGPSADRGMVFQTPTLFPWKTVRANVAHGPRMLGKANDEAFAIADRLLEMVGLLGFADRYPSTLSGGMQQRTAIARALANYPKVLLMDEPFAALDAQTRSTMQENLLQIWSKVGATVVFVTHDIDEAIFLADRILVMSASPGRILRDMTIDLPRPRDADMMLGESFIELKRRCLGLIREESRRAFEQQHATAR